MRRKVTHEHLSAYVDARLSPRWFRHVARHLEEHPEARWEVARLRHLVAALGRLHHRHPEAPEEFWPAAFARLRHLVHSGACGPRRRERLAAALKWLALACALAAALQFLAAYAEQRRAAADLAAARARQTEAAHSLAAPTRPELPPTAGGGKGSPP
jgi:anti-sigma factor RsiW